MNQRRPDVVIIGAGLAGLSCAVRLTQAGTSTMLLEATDRVGGRVRSDVVDGFTLDHGFQVLATAYPACRQLLDYRNLRLAAFEPGALIRHRGHFVPLGDPWRRPLKLFSVATSPVGSWGDKLRIARLRLAARRGTLDDLLQRPAEPTIGRLQRLGFSPAFIDQFFRPFLGGVFLDPTLETSSRMLDFVFRMLSAGDAALPADGMAAIPRQLAESLPRGTIRLGQSVERIDEGALRLSSGETLRPEVTVVATESTAAATLLDQPRLQSSWRHSVTHYFAADRSPEHQKLLILAGDEYPAGVPTADATDGRIGTVAVLSDVAPSYAPAGQSLISVTTTQPAGYDNAAGAAAIGRQLVDWFGDSVHRWRHLRSYAIPFALPVRPLDALQPVLLGGSDAKTIVCGDHCDTPSIQGAMASGLKAADIVLSL